MKNATALAMHTVALILMLVGVLTAIACIVVTLESRSNPPYSPDDKAGILFEAAIVRLPALILLPGGILLWRLASNYRSDRQTS